MSTQAPLVSATGIWYAYFPVQTQPGDNNPHILTTEGAEALGNGSLFTDAPDSGVALTHRATINIDVHAECEHEVAIERLLGVQIDKAGTVINRGQAIFITGYGNASYQGILEAGHVVRTFVSAPGDVVVVKGGYVSVTAQPI